MSKFYVLDSFKLVIVNLVFSVNRSEYLETFEFLDKLAENLAKNLKQAKA